MPNEALWLGIYQFGWMMIVINIATLVYAIYITSIYNARNFRKGYYGGYHDCLDGETPIPGMGLEPDCYREIKKSVKKPIKKRPVKKKITKKVTKKRTPIKKKETITKKLNRISD